MIKRIFRGNERRIPNINYDGIVKCNHCKKFMEIDINVNQDQVLTAIDKFIDDTSEDELLEWAGPEHCFDYEVVKYVEEGIEQMCLGQITKDQFIEELINIAKIERNLIDVKNLK